MTHTHTHTRTLVGRQRRPDRLFSGRANGSFVCVSSWRHGTPHQEGLLDHIHRILFQVSIDSFAFFFIFLVCVCVFLARFLWTYVLQQPTPRRYKRVTKPVGCLLLDDWVGWIDYVCSPTIRRMDEGTHIYYPSLCSVQRKSESRFPRCGIDSVGGTRVEWVAAIIFIRVNNSRHFFSVIIFDWIGGPSPTIVCCYPDDYFIVLGSILYDQEGNNSIETTMTTGNVQ